MAGAVVIAMDGPSGSGKSSTARGVAQRLGLAYLDTGAQFRAVTAWLLGQGIDVHDVDAVSAVVPQVVIESGTDPEDPRIAVGGRDVSVEIRGDAVTASVSPVATVPAVRRHLLTLQRSIIEESLPAGGIVVEGRDVGSVVWPDAAVKLYLTADPAARAARRAAETGSAGDAAAVAATEASLLARDAIDSARATAPLTVPDGAIHVDTTHLTLAEVIDTIVGIVDEVQAAEARP